MGSEHQQKTILIIDDEQDIAIMLRMTLEQYGLLILTLYYHTKILGVVNTI
jgi:DNA-binding NtrC family response regulator